MEIFSCVRYLGIVLVGRVCNTAVCSFGCAASFSGHVVEHDVNEYSSEIDVEMLNSILSSVAYLIPTALHLVVISKNSSSPPDLDLMW